MADGSASIAPPHNLAAEAAVLGAILFDNTAFKSVSELIEAEHFYAPAHRHLFEVIAAQIAAGHTADGVTLSEHFHAEEKLTEIGGTKYLLDLIDAAAFGPEIRDYAWIIRDLWTRRALIRFGADVQADATLMPVDRNGQAAAMDASAGLESILKSAMIRTRQINMADEVMDGVIGRISETLASGKPLPAGISTGLADLDEQLGKMHPGDLIVLAGRPGMGKTAISLHLAHRSLRRDQEGFEHPARCAFFSLEMDDDPLAHRVMSMAARFQRKGKVPYRNIRKGRIGQNEAAILKAAVAHLPKTVAWHTTGDLTLPEIVAGCRQASRKLGGLDLVIIDYLQLIQYEIGRGENDAGAIGKVTKGLKALAKELGVPIICLSQLSREVEQRDNKRPQLSDLRASGAIEQDADAVVFVYRDEYYLAKEEPKGGPSTTNTKWHEWQNELREAEGVVELIAAKVRQGKPGTIKVHVEFETNTVCADKRELQQEGLL
ncbi:MAG: AAA family ATPase [Acidobacteria bacterium]|nr:AAA family ATPase [Acidobacteriota bacterium]